MLISCINNVPYSKLIIIEDNLKKPGKEFLNYFLKLHTAPIHYFVFEGNFLTTKASTAYLRHVQCYDFVSDFSGWLSNRQEFLSVIKKVNLKGSVIVIDSLVNVIIQYGVPTVYNLLHRLKLNEGIQRIVSLLHMDVMQDSEDLSKYFKHLATVSIVLMPLNNSRLSYTYKKRGGKVIKQIQDYTFFNGLLNCTSIERVDSSIIKQNTDAVLSDNLTTFRLTLNDTEKEARSQLVLPYLPKYQPVKATATTSEVSYNFDETDDWDEEDPDDDLDI